jgi:hypothetical protein
VGGAIRCNRSYSLYRSYTKNRARMSNRALKPPVPEVLVLLHCNIGVWKCPRIAVPQLPDWGTCQEKHDYGFNSAILP